MNKRILTRIANKMGIEPNYTDDVVIVLQVNDGLEFHTVDAIIYKDLAVHVTYNPRNGFCSGDYAITHIPSGMAVKNMLFAELVSLTSNDLDALNQKAFDAWADYGDSLKGEILG